VTILFIPDLRLTSSVPLLCHTVSKEWIYHPPERHSGAFETTLQPEQIITRLERFDHHLMSGIVQSWRKSN
jgi:hypothetical protein